MMVIVFYLVKFISVYIDSKLEDMTN